MENDEHNNNYGSINSSGIPPNQGQTLKLTGIQGKSVEIMSIDSCSLYEFRITAVSKYGESKPVILVNYTGKSFFIKKFRF